MKTISRAVERLQILDAVQDSTSLACPMVPKISDWQPLLLRWLRDAPLIEAVRAAEEVGGISEKLGEGK